MLPFVALIVSNFKEILMSNPLLSNTGPYRLPDFQSVRAEHVIPALNELIARYREGVEQWLKSENRSQWDTLMRELDWADDLDRAWSVISHLHSVADNSSLRKAYNEGLELLTEHEYWRQHHDGIYAAYKALSESHDFDSLDPEQQRIVELELRDFELEGVALSRESRETYRELVMKLSQLGAGFSQNLLDARDGWELLLESPDRLRGLAQADIDRFASLASARGKEGWLVDLSYPSYHAVITHAEDRDLRFEIYRAYSTCASDQGPNAGQWDNGPVFDQILQVRYRIAQILGFDNYVDYALSRRMANSPQDVVSFLTGLSEQAIPEARRQFELLQTFASANGADLPLDAWDIPFWSERYRKAELDLSDELLKPFFSLNQMLEALEFTAHSVFGIRLEEDSSLNGWHEDVRFFWLVDRDANRLGGLYMDLYARPSKRDGAWMDGCLSRRRIEDKTQLPIAYLVCNFAAPVGDQPSLLTHHDVETLFHEFGHCLHHLLTRIEWPQINGINNVEWDAVELPSQLLENWCWEEEMMTRFAIHHRTGEPLPADVRDRLLRSRRFQKALALVRQLEFAIADFRLHLEYDPDRPQNPNDLLNEVRESVAVIEVPEWNRFLNGFGHIFGGGYAAGYYSYLWAEQLAADAWDQFLEMGVFDKTAGDRLRNEILAVGSSRPAMESFIAFRGRKPDPQPLLESYGLNSGNTGTNRMAVS